MGGTASSPATADVVSIVCRLAGLFAADPAPRADPDDMLLDDLGFSSVRLLELAFLLEDLFAMEPAAMGEAPPVGTVNDLCEFLLEKVANGEARVPTEHDVDSALAGM